MRLIFGKNSSKKAVIRLSLDAGSGVEFGGAWTPGIAHVVEHMMFQGSNKLSHDDLVRNMARLGANFNAYTSHSKVSFYVEVPEDNFLNAAELFSAMFFDRKFSREDFDKEKNVVLEEERGSRDDINSLVWEHVCKFICNGPMSAPVIGTEESIKSITLEELQAFYDNFYKHKNMMLTITKSSEKDVKKVAKLFGGDDGIFEKANPVKNSYTKQKKKIMYGKVQQAKIAICYKSFPVANKEVRDLMFAEKFFSSGMDSRLFRNVRQNAGLCYSIGSTSFCSSDIGWLMIWVETGSKTVNNVIKLVDKEVKNLLVNGPNEEEMERAKNKYLSELYGSSETSCGLNTTLTNIGFYNLPSLKVMSDNIRNTKVKQIKKVCESVFDNKNKQVFVYLPETE